MMDFRLTFKSLFGKDLEGNQNPEYSVVELARGHDYPTTFFKMNENGNPRQHNIKHAFSLNIGLLYNCHFLAFFLVANSFFFILES